MEEETTEFVNVEFPGYMEKIAFPALQTKDTEIVFIPFEYEYVQSGNQKMFIRKK